MSSTRAVAFCIPFPSRWPDHHSTSPMVATTCRIARSSASVRVLRGAARRPGAGAFPHRGSGALMARAGPWRGQNSILQKG
jgi:hypothetical protein